MKRTNPAEDSPRRRDRAASSIAILSVLAIVIATAVVIAALGGMLGPSDRSDSATSNGGVSSDSTAGDRVETETRSADETQVRAWEDWFRNLLSTAQEEEITDVELRGYELNQSTDTVIVSHTPEPDSSHDISLAIATMRGTYQHMINYTIHHEQPIWRADFRGRIVSSNGTLIATYRIENEWVRAYLRGEMNQQALQTRITGTLEMEEGVEGSERAVPPAEQQGNQLQRQLVVVRSLMRNGNIA